MFGTPALVMSRLPGGPFLAPARRERWIGDIAETLARAQSFDLRGDEPEQLLREQGRRDLTLTHFRARLRAFTARALSEL